MSPLVALLLTLPLSATPTDLRVALSRSAAEVLVGSGARVEPGGQNAAGALFTAAADQLRWGGKSFGTQLTLQPANGPLRIELRSRAGRSARLDEVPGSLTLTARGDRLVVVNRVPLEEYLRGVVPLEIGSRGAPAALEAQAIAARSFALNRRGDGRRPVADFDVAVTQAYRGLGPATPATDAAARATAGQVLRADGETVEAVYSHCCGGATASGETAWNAPIPGTAPRHDRTPAEPVHLFGPALLEFLTAPAGWCQADAMNRWTRDWSWAEVAQRLAPRVAALRGKPDLGPVRSLQVTARGPSGRATVLTVTGAKGSAEVSYDGGIRAFLADEQGALPSTLFALQRDGDRLRVRGGGHGHGVGMCQSGALAMAAAGNDCETILRHYYPTATLTPAAAAR